MSTTYFQRKNFRINRESMHKHTLGIGGLLGEGIEMNRQLYLRQMSDVLRTYLKTLLLGTQCKFMMQDKVSTPQGRQF